MIRKSLLFLAAFLVLGIVLILAVGSYSYRGAISEVAVAGKVVALTYDDGPNPPHTQSLLALLGAEGVKATFFVKARNAEAFPDDLLAIARAGHEIGNHSYHHRPMASFNKSNMLEEVQRSGEIIERIVGYAPTLFRPPYGMQGIGLQQALTELELDSILMSTHGLDWELDSGRTIADKVLEGVKPGGIILLHDGHGDVDDPGAQKSRAASIVATKLVIDELRAQGFTFATVSELLAMQVLE
ncbi:MAG: polysaccharide deacetylase family protein [Halioglobus sp.]